MSIYNIDNLRIQSVDRVPSECVEGKTVEYNGYCKHYELICCLNAISEVTFQNIKMRDEPGTVRFLPKHIENNTYIVKNIQNGECIDIFFATDTPLPATVFLKDYSLNKKIPQLFIKLHNIWSKKELGYQNKCNSVFYDILFEMQRSDLQFSPRSHIAKIVNGVEYIHSHYCDTDFDYPMLAQLSGISYTYFKKLFRENYGITPSEYVKKLKIQYACELLSTNRLSVSQVAGKCGYENIYYFSRVFKAVMGVSPSEYKKQL